MHTALSCLPPGLACPRPTHPVWHAHSCVPSCFAPGLVQKAVLQLCVDTTWRLVVEGHGTILVGVMAPDQHFHAVGYCVVSSDDTDGHEHCFRQLKKGVEDTVDQYASAGIQI